MLTAIQQAIAKDRQARQEQAEGDDLRRRLATLTPREREVLAFLIALQAQRAMLTRSDG